MDAIVVEGLRKRYGDVQALDGVSFVVGEGVVFGLLGPNGAGKSTTVRVLVTLTRALRRPNAPGKPPPVRVPAPPPRPPPPRAPAAGRAGVPPPSRVRRSIGPVPQDSGVDGSAPGRETPLLQGRVQGMGGGALR